MSSTSVDMVGLTDVGKVRKANEDALLLMPESWLCCVADGMGGVAGGELASRTVCEAVRQAVAAFLADWPIARRVEALRVAIDQASRDILAWADAHGLEGTGSTALVLVLDPLRPYQGFLLHAGDSRAYRFRAGGLEQLTRDHSVAASYGHGRDEALPAMLRNLVTNAIGLGNSVHLEETPVSWRRGDLVLLCTDGLYRMVDGPTLAKILAQPVPLSEKAQLLLQAALDGGGRDNVTVALVQLDFEEESGEAAEAESETHKTDAPATNAAAEPPAEGAGRNTQDSDIIGSPVEPETHDRTAEMRPLGTRRSGCMLRGAVLAAVLAIAGLIVILLFGEKPGKPYPPSITGALVGMPREPLPGRIEQAQRDGDWAGLAEALASMPGAGDAGGADLATAKAWAAKWEQAKADPVAARSEWERVRTMADQVLVSMSIGGLAPLEPAAWPEEARAAATAYCRSRLEIQQNLFAAIDDYVTRAREVLDVFGDPSPESEVAPSGEDPFAEDRRRGGSSLRNAHDLVRRLNRWKNQARDFPVAADDLQEINVRCVEPLERNLRRSFENVASRFDMADSPAGSAGERRPHAPPAGPEERFRADVESKLHHSSAGRRELLPLLAEVLAIPAAAKPVHGDTGGEGR